MLIYRSAVLDGAVCHGDGTGRTGSITDLESQTAPGRTRAVAIQNTVVQSERGTVDHPDKWIVEIASEPGRAFKIDGVQSQVAAVYREQTAGERNGIGIGKICGFDDVSAPAGACDRDRRIGKLHRFGQRDVILQHDLISAAAGMDLPGSRNEFGTVRYFNLLGAAVFLIGAGVLCSRS